MNLNFNNIVYYIDDSKSILSLLENPIYYKLPMKFWRNLVKYLLPVYSQKTILYILKYKINQYDKSPEVNSFKFNNKDFWFDKETRLGLVNLVNSSKDTVDLFIDNLVYTFAKEKVLKFLQDLEVYAGKCFITTLKHLVAVLNLKTEQELVDYNYKSGYPEKIILDL